VYRILVLQAEIGIIIVGGGVVRVMLLNGGESCSLFGQPGKTTALDTSRQRIILDDHFILFYFSV
jgi:hypothetical protein